MASGMRLPRPLVPLRPAILLTLTRRAESQEAGETPGILVEGCRAEEVEKGPGRVSGPAVRAPAMAGARVVT